MPLLSDTFSHLSENLTFVAPKNWLQGRTAYGGFSSAAALSFVLKYYKDDLPPLKSVQVSFIAPVTQDILFQSQLLRRGKSATQISVDAIIDDMPAMRAGFIFASSRPSNIQHNYVEMPIVEKPESYALPPIEMPKPDFFDNFEVRFVSKNTPVSNATNPELLAWVSLKDSANLPPEVVLLLIGDCLPPATMACFNELAPISSMTWSINFPQPAKPSKWFLLRTRSLISLEGYSYQIMEAWNEMGELALLSTQTVAIFT